MKIKSYYSEYEVFLSNETDYISQECINGKCKIVEFGEFNKLLEKNKDLVNDIYFSRAKIIYKNGK